MGKVRRPASDKKAAEAAYSLHFLGFVLVYCCNAWQDPSNWKQFIHRYSRLRQALFGSLKDALTEIISHWTAG